MAFKIYHAVAVNEMHQVILSLVLKDMTIRIFKNLGVQRQIKMEAANQARFWNFSQFFLRWRQKYV